MIRVQYICVVYNDGLVCCCDENVVYSQLLTVMKEPVLLVVSFVVALHFKLRLAIVYLTSIECQQNSTNISPQHEDETCNDFFVAFVISIIIIIVLSSGLIIVVLYHVRKCKFETM